MKFRTIISLQILLFLFIGLNLYAQPEYYKRMIDAQCNEIVKALNLDDKKKESEFVDLYKKYLTDLKKNKQSYIKYFKMDVDTLNNEQADAIIINNIKSDKNAIGIREKYYAEFKTVLTPKQMLVVYQTEADITRRLTMEFCKRKGQHSK
jgi:hypothetical protein